MTDRWKYAPETPTAKMLDSVLPRSDNFARDALVENYETMLAAAPSPPALSGEDHVAEFGEYLAKAAEFYVQTVDPIISDAADPDITTDAHRALRSAIYEFRKRAAKAASLIERQAREIAEKVSRWEYESTERHAMDLTERLDASEEWGKSIRDRLIIAERELAEARAALKQLIADYGDVPDATDSDAQSVMDRARLASRNPADGERR